MSNTRETVENVVAGPKFAAATTDSVSRSHTSYVQSAGVGEDVDARSRNSPTHADGGGMSARITRGKKK